MAYHMFFGFHLAPGVTEAQARERLETLSANLRAEGVLLATAPLARRHRHPIMDTAKDISAEYFTTMSFRDRKQADASVKLIYKREPSTDAAHVAFIDSVSDPFFLCFDDAAA